MSMSAVVIMESEFALGNAARVTSLTLSTKTWLPDSVSMTEADRRSTAMLPFKTVPVAVRLTRFASMRMGESGVG